MIGGERLGIVDASRLKQAAVYAGLRSRGVSSASALARITGKWGAAFTAVAAEPFSVPPDHHVRAWRVRRAKFEAYSAAAASAMPAAPSTDGALPATGTKAQASPGPMVPAPRLGSPSIQDIRAIVVALSGVTEAQMVGFARPQRISWPRQIAQSLARRWGGWSTGQIGACFGNQDHTTIVHSTKAVQGRLLAGDPGTVALWASADAAIRAMWPSATASDVWWSGEPNPMVQAASTKPAGATSSARHRRAQARRDGMWTPGS